MKQKTKKQKRKKQKERKRGKSLPRPRPRPPYLYFSSFALYYTQYLHTYLPAYIANYYSRSTFTEADLGNNLRGFDTRHFSGKPALLIRTRICYLLLRLSQHPANEEVFFFFSCRNIPPSKSKIQLLFYTYLLHDRYYCERCHQIMALTSR